MIPVGASYARDITKIFYLNRRKYQPDHTVFLGQVINSLSHGGFRLRNSTNRLTLANNLYSL